MRRACFVIRSKAGATAVAGAVHTRNTASMPSRHPSRVSGRVRSPRTTSTCGGNRAAPGLRAIARTRAPVAANRETTWRPTVPVPPMTRMRFILGPSTIYQLTYSTYQRPKLRILHQVAGCNTEGWKYRGELRSPSSVPSFFHRHARSRSWCSLQESCGKRRGDDSSPQLSGGSFSWRCSWLAFRNCSGSCRVAPVRIWRREH